MKHHIRFHDPKASVAIAADLQRARTGRALPRIVELARKPLPGEPSTRTVALIGCGKAKGDKPAPAREVYTSALFRKSLALAELVANETFIVSARFGLVPLDSIVRPYDCELRSFSKLDQKRWGENVVSTINSRAYGFGGGLVELKALPFKLRVVLLMGATYADPIIAALDRRRALATCWTPAVDLLRGLEIGDRLAFLNRAIDMAGCRRKL